MRRTTLHTRRPLPHNHSFLFTVEPSRDASWLFCRATLYPTTFRVVGHNVFLILLVPQTTMWEGHTETTEAEADIPGRRTCSSPPRHPIWNKTEPFLELLDTSAPEGHSLLQIFPHEKRARQTSPPLKGFALSQETCTKMSPSFCDLVMAISRTRSQSEHAVQHGGTAQTR